MAKTPKLDAKGYPKFGMRDKIAYAAGDLGCNMSFALKGTVQTFWLVYMMLRRNKMGARRAECQAAARRKYAGCHICRNSSQKTAELRVGGHYI